MMKEMTIADKLQRTFNNLPQEKKDRINRILENYEGTAFATPHEPSDEEKLVQEITALREQVEKLTKFAQNAEQLYYKDMAERTTQIEALTKERDELVNAIDNEMVVAHMGVFNAGDDPKVALNKICCYAQDLGKFFAEDACKEQLLALAEQNEKMRKVLLRLACLGNGDQYGNSIGNCIAQEALSLPDLATIILNKEEGE